MMDNYNQQNIVVEEGNMLQFMPNQIYIVNEPLRFENVDSSDTFTSDSNLNEYEQRTDGDGMEPSFMNRTNGDQFPYLQMYWNQQTTSYQAHFMVLGDNILTDQNETESHNISNSLSVYEVEDSDEEDDVVFVDAFPKEKDESQNVKTPEEQLETTMPKEERKPRRNPSRQARNRKFGKKSNDENIYEEDFCMLDSSEEESSPDESATKTSSIIEEEAQNLSVKDMKKWPVNGLHERPEYNILTQKIEKFDYTIREIQGTVKKPKRDDSKKTTPRKKPAVKKYVPKKRGKKKGSINKEEEFKIPLDSLKDLIEENYTALTGFIRNVRSRCNNNSHICHSVVLSSKNKENVASTSNSTEQNNMCLKDYETLMSNQSRLFAVVNKISHQDALTCLKENSENDS